MKKNPTWIALFLMPTLLLFFLIFGASTLILFGSSFFEWRLAAKINFNGIANYLKLLKDSTFYMALGNTAIWVVLQGTVHVALGVLVALLLSRKMAGWKMIRTVYLIPNIISSAALGVLCVSIFSPRIGMVNSLIRMLGFQNFEVNWFADYRTAFFAVTMTWLPFAAVCMILVLGEIAALDESILEAGMIDGATRLQTDLHIILPSLRNIIMTCVILAATSALKNFDIIFITTNGGPGEVTTNLPIFVYKTAMLENNYGYANTISVAIVLLGIVIISVISRVSRMGESDI